MAITWRDVLGPFHPSWLPEQVAESYGVPKENDGRNDSTDAFRHAYASALATYLAGAEAAKAIGDWNEERFGSANPPAEKNMDLWNNSIGRQIGATAQSIDDIGRLVYEAYLRGDLLTNTAMPSAHTWNETGVDLSILPDILNKPIGRMIMAMFSPVSGLLRQTLIEVLNELYKDARIVRDPTILSPIVLDLDRDGVETTNVKDGAYFDHDGNGFAEQTGWADVDDGILVMDRNGNSSIDDGKELFGNETLLADGTKAANGFQALAELDGNADGKVDANDAAFSQLKVWQDINGDGLSNADELKGLSELGIQSINTGYTNSTVVDVNGNEHRQVGSFTWSDGTTNAAEDVWFQRDTTYTIANEWLEVPADIAALPDLQGYGNVYDLHQAMVRDTSGQLKSPIEKKDHFRKFSTFGKVLRPLYEGIEENLT